MRVEEQPGTRGVPRGVAALDEQVVLLLPQRLHRHVVLVVAGSGPHRVEEGVGPRDPVRPAMADLAGSRVHVRDLGGGAAPLGHAPDAADVGRREVEVPVVAPVAAPVARRVGERLKRRAAHRDLPELRSREEADPPPVGGEERPVAALGALERRRLGRVQRADEDPVLAVLEPDVGDASPVAGDRDRVELARAQLVPLGKRDADVSAPCSPSGRRETRASASGRT